MEKKKGILEWNENFGSDVRRYLLNNSVKSKNKEESLAKIIKYLEDVQYTSKDRKRKIRAKTDVKYYQNELNKLQRSMNY